MRTLLSLVGLLGVMGGAAWAEANRTGPGTSVSDGLQIPHPAVVPVTLAVPPPTVVNSHIVYLNKCTGGCKITRGNGDDSRTDTSGIAPSNGTLKQLNAAVDFAGIKACVQSALAAYNVTVTEVDPGTVEHFEIMIAGSPAEIGFDSAFEGVASYLCGGAPGSCTGTYIPNSITFAFANAYGVPTSLLDKPAKTALMCGVALQEVAHGWTLDHATASSDPMTYKTYTTPLSFRDGAPCGSDCFYNNNTTNSFGVACGGGGGTSGTHVCMENGAATQNEVQILMNLFGPAGAATPTVAITSPASNAAEQTSHAFMVNATCTTTDAVKEIDLYTDDVFANSVTASPATFTTAFSAGSHKLTVVCGTTKQASASTSINVIVGSTCTQDADCGGTKICYQSACIEGPGGAGGLGAACTANTDCASTMCGSNGGSSACVITCDPANSTCPSGFDCLDNGAGGGVCWVGSGSSGGCATGRGGSPVTILFGLGFAALWITRRNRK
jgi:hypothetical protein